MPLWTRTVVQELLRLFNKLMSFRLIFTAASNSIVAVLLERQRAVARQLRRAMWLQVWPSLILIGCATVHQEDLDAWVGVPVAALDMHSIFLTFPMARTLT